MSIEEMNTNAYDLSERYKNINNFIKNNPNTDPNFCEMVDCIVDFGVLLSNYNFYYENNGYPELEEGKAATHYDISKFVPEVKNAQDNLNEMLRLREKSDFFLDFTAKKFMIELVYRCEVGEYNVPYDPDLASIKKEVLCKTAGIYFYIWQVKRNELDYQYDNQVEFTNLIEEYEVYKGSSGIQERKVNLDNTYYEGPQFGEIIEDMLTSINKNYKYNNTNISGKTK